MEGTYQIFAPAALTQEISPRVPLNRGLVGTQSRCGPSVEQKIYLALAWIRIQDRPVRGLVTINAALFNGVTKG
jgi:hypothetical protein